MNRYFGYHETPPSLNGENLGRGGGNINLNYNFWHPQSGLYLITKKFICLFVCSHYMVIYWPLYQYDFICNDIENTYEYWRKNIFLILISGGISFIKLQELKKRFPIFKGTFWVLFRIARVTLIWLLQPSEWVQLLLCSNFHLYFIIEHRSIETMGLFKKHLSKSLIYFHNIFFYSCGFLSTVFFFLKKLKLTHSIVSKVYYFWARETKYSVFAHSLDFEGKYYRSVVNPAKKIPFLRVKEGRRS